MRRQQGVGGVMIWAGIIGDELVGPFRVPDGLKLTAATYCEFLKTALEPWLDDLPLSRLKSERQFSCTTTPSHAAKATTTVLKSLGFVNESLMIWPPNSPDLNPIESMWSIVERHVYANESSIHLKMSCGCFLNKLQFRSPNPPSIILQTR